MSKILWKWVFPDHGKVNPENYKLDSASKKKIIKLSTAMSIGERESFEVYKFEAQILRRIEEIIERWVNSYVDYKESLGEEIHLNRNLYEEASIISDEMSKEVNVIVKTLDVVEWIAWVEIDDNTNKIQIIETYFEDYSDKVANLLIQNEVKLEQKAKSAKRFRRRQNAKKKKRS